MTGHHVRWRTGEITPLRQWCRDNRVSYSSLAERVHLSRRALIRIAVGTAIPSGRTAERIARETGLSTADVVRSSAKART